MTWHAERTTEYARAGAADIRTLYVRPADWGEGVGTVLLDEALERLPALVDAVVLETFRANEQGRSFYESRSFEVRETSEYEVGESSYPTVVFEREL
ncbi:MAG: GNAT family N-acetyltransferase [Halolamina sp.]|uniref:GNAT family N-acetyltransferase n=1 Tax=Halolamina sp. TaxID=1940283 RepID=UPI002FC2D312